MKNVIVTVVCRTDGSIEYYDAPALSSDGRVETFTPGIVLNEGDVLTVETRKIPS